MEHKVKKMKFLAIKLSSLKSELEISKEILQSASGEVNNMYMKKYFPESVAKEKQTKNTDIKESSEEERNKNKKEQEPKKKKDNVENKEKEIQEKEVQEKNVDPEVKVLFRKISLKIHPDKLIGLEEGFERDRKTSLYTQARAAYGDNDVIILSNIALELGLEIPEITEEKLKKAEKQISSIKKELEQIESTFVWNWFFTEDPKKKDSILEKLFNIMYERNNKNNPRP